MRDEVAASVAAIEGFLQEDGAHVHVSLQVTGAGCSVKLAVLPDPERMLNMLLTATRVVELCTRAQLTPAKKLLLIKIQTLDHRFEVGAQGLACKCMPLHVCVEHE